MEEYIYLDNAATTFPKPEGFIGHWTGQTEMQQSMPDAAVMHWQNRQNS